MGVASRERSFLLGLLYTALELYARRSSFGDGGDLPPFLCLPLLDDREDFLLTRLESEDVRDSEV